MRRDEMKQAMVDAKNSVAETSERTPLYSLNDKKSRAVTITFIGA
jgi:hypothetical protein